MGKDGKTGETLVKTTLAPMFRDRNLRVLSWYGYNLLGNRDGLVLENPDHGAGKLRSKDRALRSLLGRTELRSKVQIDYVPSLDDWKTAWDFVHFQGFLGAKMSLQFTWQGCDSALAAPLVLDLARFADRALREGEGGPMTWLASFFKDPLEAGEHGFGAQFEALRRYARSRGGPGTRIKKR
jgi:myo-inositol-1-phosphate synthase